MSFDVAVLGSGFAGSLTALLLQRIGLQAVLIDRGRHPRFAIGESTTPSANLVWGELCRRYDLPRLAPLAKYGPWKQAYPEVACGPKRGFSYFQHRPGEPFHPGVNHARELLVAASSTLATADTHWLRSDFDRFLVEEVCEAGIPYFDRLLVEVEEMPHGFRLSGSRDGRPVQVDARFLIDGTGEVGVVLRRFGIPQVAREMATHSRGLFGHFTGLAPWQAQLQAAYIPVEDHPFDCDQSALHHVFDEGWMWQLRFDNGVTSAGFAFRGDRPPGSSDLSAEDEWSTMMNRYPSLAKQFASAKLVAPERGLVRTGRLQRRAARAAGENWAALPNTAGFVDPLFSTGIAHSLCGIERLIGILQHHWNRPALPAELDRYQRIILTEVDVIDDIVGSCFATFSCFEAFAACCMVYFAAATTYERRRLEKMQQALPGSFLCADDAGLQSIARQTRDHMSRLMKSLDKDDVARGCEWLRRQLAPFNHVGLFEPSVSNMYRHTALPA